MTFAYPTRWSRARDVQAARRAPDELARAYPEVLAKPENALTDADEDVLDAVAAYEARAEWDADERRTVSWEQVKASLPERTNG